MLGGHGSPRREGLRVAHEDDESAPAIGSERSPHTPRGIPTEKRPVGTVPVTATPWEVRSNAFTARIERTTAMSARGHPGRKYRMSSRVMSAVAPTARVARLVSGICLIVPTNWSQ